LQDKTKGVEMDKLWETALAYKKAGRDVIPDHPTEKYPVGFSNWPTKNFTEAELEECIIKKGYGIGIRNQEGLDFDNHGSPEAEKTLEEWKKLVESLYPDLVGRLLIEKTQHDGFHVCWLCKVIEENQKLASRPPTEEELKIDPKIKSITFIETRGIGGQFVVSPTPGYVLIQGDWCNLPQITPEERKVLLQCAKSFNLTPISTEDFRTLENNFDGDRPGDIFNKKGIDEALELLIKNEWTIVYKKDNTIYLRRPGKDSGVSATFGYIAKGILYNFSSNADPFDPDRAYSPFAIYTLLQHDGNYSIAARTIAKKYELDNSSVSNSNEKSKNKNFKLTDTGNSEWIASLYGDKIRFDHRRKRWLVWQDHRWQPDKNQATNRFAIESARQRYFQATNIKDSELKTKIAKWAISSESRSKLESATSILKSLLPIADSGDNWDSNGMLLSCSNGILNLKTGLLRDGKPEDRITMISGCAYDSQASCPRWKKFVEEVFEDNKDLIHYVHKAIGYSMTGDMSEQVAFFGFGSGSNGKSVFFKTISSVLGDYAYDAPVSLLQRNYGISNNTNDLASIEFKRFLVSSETLSTSKINEQRIKGITGGDSMTARYLYSEFFTFDPICKTWLFVNHKPQVEDDSYGFWRRVRMIPFNRTFSPAEQDKNLISILKKEYSGILNWMLEGCALWQSEGLNPTPEIVKLATQDYREENDELFEFVVDKCKENGSAKASELYKIYKHWAENDQGLSDKEVMTNSAFGRRMTDKFSKKATNKGIFYLGISLLGEGFTHLSEASDELFTTLDKPSLTPPPHDGLQNNDQNPSPEANLSVNPSPNISGEKSYENN